ncbi:hypothetical protein VDGL01_07876 [Verticillium dahliae]
MALNSCAQQSKTKVLRRRRPPPPPPPHPVDPINLTDSNQPWAKAPARLPSSPVARRPSPVARRSSLVARHPSPMSPYQAKLLLTSRSPAPCCWARLYLSMLTAFAELPCEYKPMARNNVQWTSSS